MTGYSDVFGGSSVQAADVQFRAVALSTSIYTVWPAFATTGNECARIMKVTPSAGSLAVNLPDATLTSNGMDVLFDNPGAFAFTVYDYAGGTVATVSPGEVKYLYLSDNSTAAGTWRVTLFGVGTSSNDAAQLAGYGLKAISSTLNTAAVVTEISGNTTVTLADRSKVFVWTGGSGTLTLPSTSGSTSDFAIEVHNQGSGTLTIATTGGVVIDGSSTISLIVTESCFVHMGSTDWYTVGRGRNTQFNFTQLNKVVTGGTTNLSLTEASSVVQTYTGVLLSNQTVNQPAVVQVYYVSNATTGAYTLTFGCVAGGTTVGVTQGQAAILFCDGTNVINANTSLSGGIATIIFGAGSASTPSVALSTASTGFYSSGSNEIGVSNNGNYSGKFTTGGFKTEVTGAAAVQAISSGGASSLIVDRPAGSIGSLRMRTATVDRWALEATSTAEGGANAGTNLALNAYNDAGVLLGTAFTIPRSTQIATFTQPPVMSGASITGVPISTGISGLGTGVATALAVNVGSAGAPVVLNGALGTPSSGTVTNLTGTASININGTVGATTPTTGAFTTVVASSTAAVGGSAATLTALTVNESSTYGIVHTDGAQAFAWRIEGTSYKLSDRTAAADKMEIGATGTTVTGALNALGNLSATGSLSVGTTSTVGVVKLARFTDGAYVGELRLSGTGTSPAMELYNGVTSATNIYSAGAVVGAFTGTGLAVTGTLSSTGTTTAAAFIPSSSTVPTNGMYLPAANTLGWATNSTGVMRLDASGNLGIGVTPSAWQSPYKVIDVGTRASLASEGTATQLSLNAYYNSNWIYKATDEAALYEQFNGGHTWSSAASGTAGTAITFTNTMTLNASGNLGVGTNAPNFRLDVLDGTNVYRQLCLTEVKTNSTRNRTGIVAQSYVAATPAQVLLMDANASINDLFIGGAYSGAYAATNLYMYSAANSTTTTGTQVFQIAHGKSLALQGATSAAGCGISFPSTQVASSDANTLDDYEEGSYTPTIVLGSGSVTYTTQTGSYTKFGRLVTVQGRIVVNVATTPSGTLELGGLPFTSSATQKGAVTVWGDGVAAGATTCWVGHVSPSATVMRLYTYAAGAVSNPGAYVANACAFNFTATYEV